MKRNSITDEFEKADGRNLPKVDTGMMMEYCVSSPDLNIMEVRGWKARE